jgi:glycosyltransferase involved in cell wall biosynthesis
VPNIATNTTGTIDYIEHDKSGLLVPANDPESLAQAMMEIHDDSNLAVRLATGAKLFAERHLRDEAHFPKLIRVLDDVVSEFSQ